MSMTALMIGGSVLSAYGQVRQGQAQKAMYQAQAQQAQIQGRSQAIKARQEALAYRQEGVKSLENTRRNMATMNARGAAGALDPFSGSVGNLMTLNMGYGVEDYYTALDNVALAQENQNIARAAAQYQASIYRSAGSMAMQNAYIGAAGSLAQAGGMAYQAGAFSGGGSASASYAAPARSYAPYQSLGSGSAGMLI
jgi:hypothetical protein